MEDIDLKWRGEVDNSKLNLLHAAAFDHEVLDENWLRRLSRYSLGWVTAYDSSGNLVGFVNVIWDGGVHAWIQDTIVAEGRRHQGIGRHMVELVVEHVRDLGCEWLHVDFDDEHRGFYLGAAGFRETSAGLIEL